MRQYFLVLILMIVGMFALNACDNKPKERKLNPTEKAWIDSHPDGTLRNKPEDFAEFAIKDKCDPSLDEPWQFKDRLSALDDIAINAEMPPTENAIPVAVMDVTLLSGTTFEFSGMHSTDADGVIEHFEWLINYEKVADTPSFRMELRRDQKYLIILNVWNMNSSDRDGNSYKMGSSVYYELDVSKATCPEE